MNRCQAILIVVQDPTATGMQAGNPCNAQACSTRNGRHVCWLHQGAMRPLQFDDMGTERQEPSA